MREIAWAVLALILPVTAAAQGFELGGSISRGCTGDSSGFCGPETGAMPAGCERVLLALGSAAGDWATQVNNVTIIAGLSGRVADRVRLTGGVRLHNFAGEGLSTSEAFFAAGVLFGRF